MRLLRLLLLYLLAWAFIISNLFINHLCFRTRAISESGHPVAGADVRIQDKKLGVTDSFGEWRRYLKLKPGSQFDLQVIKEKDKVRYQGTKPVMIPHDINPSGGTELRCL